MAPCRSRTPPRGPKLQTPNRVPGGLEWPLLVYFIVQRPFRGLDPPPRPLRQVLAGAVRPPGTPPRRPAPAGGAVLELPVWLPPPGRPAAYAGGAPPPALAPMAGGPGSTAGPAPAVGETGFMIITAPGGPTPGASYAVQLPRPWVSGGVPDCVRAPPAPAGAPRRTEPRALPRPRHQNLFGDRFAGGCSPARAASNGTRYPGRPVSTSRYAPGTAVPDPGDARSGSRDRGTGPPPGGERCRDWRCSPAHRVALPGSTGSYFAGSSPVHPVHAPGAPRAPGESRVLEPHVPVHRASVRPGAAGERGRGARRTSRRRTRTPPTRVSPWPYRCRHHRYGTGAVRRGARRAPGDLAAYAPRGSQGRVPRPQAPRRTPTVAYRRRLVPVPDRRAHRRPPRTPRESPPAAPSAVQQDRSPGVHDVHAIAPTLPTASPVSTGTATSCSGTRSPGGAGAKYIPGGPSSGPYGARTGSGSSRTPRLAPGEAPDPVPGGLHARAGGPSGQCSALGALLRGSAGRRRAARSR